MQNKTVSVLGRESKWEIGFFSAFPDLNVDMSGDIFNGWISMLVVIKRAFHSPWRYCFSLFFCLSVCFVLLFI